MVVAFSKASEKLSEAIPQEIKGSGSQAGSRAVFSHLRLRKAKLIQQGGSRALLAVGHLTDPEALLALFGLRLDLSFVFKEN